MVCEWPTTNIHMYTFADDINCCKRVCIWAHYWNITHFYIVWRGVMRKNNEYLRVGQEMIFHGDQKFLNLFKMH